MRLSDDESGLEKNRILIQENYGEDKCRKEDNLPKSLRLEQIKGKDPTMFAGAFLQKQPDTIQPMLATLVKKAPEGDGWLHEIKYDGYRMLCRVENKEVRLITRNNRDWTDKFPQLIRALKKKKIAAAVLDGEVVVLDEQGRSVFQELQNYLQNPRSKRLVYYVFDLLWYDGYNLTGVRLEERKRLLADILGLNKETSVIRYSGHIKGKGTQVWEQACCRNLEGIISKRADSVYEQKRSRSWLKIKCLGKKEFVIGGFTEPSGNRGQFGALLLGYYRQGELVYCGRVGTGFSEKDLQKIHQLLVKIERQDSPFTSKLSSRDKKGVHWVEPKLTALVSYTELTAGGRLRHPSFEGLVHTKD